MSLLSATTFSQISHHEHNRSHCLQFNNSGCHQTTNVAVPNSNNRSSMQSQSRYQQSAMKVDPYAMERYSTYEKRLTSFVSWPMPYVHKTPEELAAAGFYYIGSADRVTCFHCNLTLRDWEAEHDPVTEHRLHAQDCTFIKHHIAALAEVSSTTRPEASCKSYPEERPESCPEKRPESCPKNHPDTRAEASCQSSHSATAVPMETEHPHTSTGRIEQDFAKLVIAEEADEEINTLGNPHSNEVVESGSDRTEVMDSIPASCVDASGKMEARLLGTSDDLVSMEQVAEKGKMASKGKSKRIKSHAAENRRLKEQSLCMMCKTEKSCVLFLPCGHLVTCPDCAVNTQKCVRCSKAVLGTVRTYMV